MQTFQEHHHKLLTVLLLLGTLLILGSFSSESPKPAIAASTPGEQSVSRTSPQILDHYFALRGSRYVEMTRILTVISTGDVRKDGLLTTSGTVLQTGDQITLDITDNASYFSSGQASDSPPSSWVSGMPSPADANALCDNGDFFYFVSGIGLCGMIASDARKPDISTGGLSCNPLILENVAKGVRTFSTVCIVTTTGSVATLQANLSQVNYYRYLPVSPTFPNRYTYVLNGITFIRNIPVPMWVDTSFGPSDLVGPLSPLPPATLSWTFDVASVALPPLPTLTFWADNTSLTQGQSTNLNWTVANADSCTASGGWSGSKDSATGAHLQSVTPPVTTTYNLQCSGPGGITTLREVTIDVISACVANMGQPCVSSPNACAMTNNGTTQCNGSCSATTPSNSLCTSICASGDIRPCTTSQSCAGTETCDATGNWDGICNDVPADGCPAECSDGIDNDCDGFCDKSGCIPPAGFCNAGIPLPADPSCAQSVDITEYAQCNDLNSYPGGTPKDNDGDIDANINDKGCHSDGNPNNPGSYDPNDNDESNTIFREVFMPFENLLAMLRGIF
ncbi:hypothetical protein A3E06_00025 [Candidatus Giovannonibacteria bacterium RIFCSPHIGHO2_12_FULL_44_42]|nr:MAG: hypothetical protein UW28_C0002G0004 [Parcubacteria group bacterium GW2011_GWA2_44_13]OGF72903.1 MAG: hypothetical protein A3E06_00025 [Candidatus Giovannonibacteria bacterium RIFCSPHIGHO2_12_FULL_44_42]OGF89076.1 MAG: hypothetical protein A3I94_03890 [Candidatus Giovannonibacteria bacterium RIFCSPLOWO2_02_FULL_43_54]OGF97163.1 MAG: hypothetical protein A3H08_00205 [Candidatus Giovannonibacteria bacterium RIFCSPLOWO2_12_FULL_44_32]